MILTRFGCNISPTRMRGVRSDPESKSTLSGAGAGRMRAIVFHFIASDPVAETMKRSTIPRLERP